MAGRSPPPRSAREVVWQLHRAVFAEGAYANIVWPKLLQNSGLSAEDRRFATELAYGSLRRFGQWRVLIDHLTSGAKTIQPEVLWVLISGAHQLLAMSTPSHAAVHQTVELAKKVGVGRASGLVNAVMRRMSSRSLPEWSAALSEQLDDEQRVALQTSHPGWIVRLLEQSLRRENRGGELGDLLESHNKPARVAAVDLAGVRREGEERTKYSPLGFFPNSPPHDDSRVTQGQIRIQDEGSQLAALTLLAAKPLVEGEQILDACAGPGGKAAVIAAQAAPHKATLVALEQHAHRVQLVAQALSGLDPEWLEIHHADAVQFLAQRPQYYSRVLLDAPCTGLGALRRRPEARWTKAASELSDLEQSQSRLLDACVKALAPGGVMLYVTCSPVVQETTDQIGQVRARHPWLELVDTSLVLASLVTEPLYEVAVGTAAQLWPHRHGTDAMFMQLLRRPD